MSTRAIAPTVGAPRETVRRDALKVTHCGSPAPAERHPAIVDKSRAWAGIRHNSVTCDGCCQCGNICHMGLTCDTCGREFTGRAGARYCSGRCRTAAYRTRKDGEKPKPRRGPLGDSMISAGAGLDRAIRNWERLLADDRFPRSRRKLAHRRHYLVRARDALDALLDRWPE